MQPKIEVTAKTTLNGTWKAYRAVCVPEDASSFQVAATKKAFFAGAHAFFLLLLKLKPNIDEITELRNELDRFIRDG